MRPWGLRWRLTISYAVVTLVAAGTVSVVSAAAQASRGTIAQGDAAGELQKSAAQAAPYLDGPQPSPEALRFWVAIPILDDLVRSFGSRILAVAVLDPKGQVLVAESCPRERYSVTTADACRSSAEETFSTLLADPGGEGLVRAARAARGSATVSGSAASRGFLAAPVPSRDGIGRGALAAAFTGHVPPPPGHDPLEDLGTAAGAAWSGIWSWVVLLALVLGTATGLALSQRLVGRLRTIASTVRVWSRGDLRPAVSPGPRDELGELADDLNGMAEQLRNLLAARRELARQEERGRVQRELHDGVKQELFATTMHLAAAGRSLSGDEDAAQHLADARRSALRAQRELTAVIDELGPPALSTRTLEAALTELSVVFEHETGIEVETHLSVRADLDGRAEKVLFRVVQEGLSNVRRHSGASRAVIRLDVDGNQARLLLLDDGRGFPGEAPPGGGLGLTGMRERVEGAGGTLSISSSRPGTRLEVVLPRREPDA